MFSLSRFEIYKHSSRSKCEHEVVNWNIWSNFLSMSVHICFFLFCISSWLLFCCFPYLSPFLLLLCRSSTSSSFALFTDHWVCWIVSKQANTAIQCPVSQRKQLDINTLCQANTRKKQAMFAPAKWDCKQEVSTTLSIKRRKRVGVFSCKVVAKFPVVTNTLASLYTTNIQKRHQVLLFWISKIEMCIFLDSKDDGTSLFCVILSINRFVQS